MSSRVSKQGTNKATWQCVKTCISFQRADCFSNSSPDFSSSAVLQKLTDVSEVLTASIIILRPDDGGSSTTETSVSFCDTTLSSRLVFVRHPVTFMAFAYGRFL
jgi:hypothetical protein